MDGVPPSVVHTGAQAIAAGKYHSMVLKDDGTVWATGYNYYRQLGDGTRRDNYYYGRLGDGTTSDMRSFVKVLSGRRGPIGVDDSYTHRRPAC